MGAYIYIFTQYHVKTLGMGPIPEHIENTEDNPKHATFEIIVQEGKMLNTSLGMPRSNPSSCLQGQNDKNM